MTNFDLDNLTDTQTARINELLALRVMELSQKALAVLDSSSWRPSSLPQYHKDLNQLALVVRRLGEMRTPMSSCYQIDNWDEGLSWSDIASNLNTLFLEVVSACLYADIFTEKDILENP